MDKKLKVALIETKPSRTNFNMEFEGSFEFDRYALCSNASIKKPKKADCDIDIDTDFYHFIILVGSDTLKYFTSKNSITEFSGKLVNDKFLPVINPSMLAFKPEAKPVWEKSKEAIIGYITGTKKKFVLDNTISIGISDTEEAKQFLKDAIAYDKPYFALDTETTGLYPRDGFVLGMSMSYNGEFGVYIDSNCFDEDCEELFRTLLQKKKPVFHNAKFDISMLEYHFEIGRILNYEDTMLLHYVIDERPGTHGLKQLALKYTEYGDYEEELGVWINNYCKANKVLKRNFSWECIPFEVMSRYAGMDALVTFVLFEKFSKIKQNKKLEQVYKNILIPGSTFLTRVQDNGVPFDKGRLIATQKILQDDIEKGYEKLYSNEKVAAFIESNGELNPNSPMQLRKLLFDYLGLAPIKKTDTGADSTDAEVLEALAKQSEIPDLILDIRRKSKIKNTYIDKIITNLDSDSRLRTNFHQHTTTSGRLSSSGKLNMQQLPRDNPLVKGCIRARPGYVIVAMDLQTAEVYYAAVQSGDVALMDVFRTGGDFHSTIAKQIFGLSCPVEDVKDLYPIERQAAKAISFGIMYGAQAGRVSAEVTKSSGTRFTVTQAQEVIDLYFETFPQLKQWIEDTKSRIETNAFIYSHFGRKRRLPNVRSTDSATASHEVRSGLNFMVQSPSSDINLLGGMEAQDIIEQKGMDARIFALVHDSVLAEVAVDSVEEYKTLLKGCIQKDRGLTIPGCPIQCDFDVHEDYSIGKFDKYIKEHEYDNYLQDSA